MTDWTDLSARRAEARGALAIFIWPLRGGPESPPPGALAESSWAFPLAGLVVGVLGALAYAVFAGLGAPSLAAALAVAAAALVSGGMQERELARAADDASGGGAGALAVVLSTALRVGAVYAAGSALGIAGATGALVGAHVLARGLLPAAFYLGAPAEADPADRPGIDAVIAALVLTALLTWLALGMKAAVVATIAAAAAMALAALVARRGGALGAMEQAAETAALLAAAALA